MATLTSYLIVNCDIDPRHGNTRLLSLLGLLFHIVNAEDKSKKQDSNKRVGSVYFDVRPDQELSELHPPPPSLHCMQIEMDPCSRALT